MIKYVGIGMTLLIGCSSRAVGESGTHLLEGRDAAVREQSAADAGCITRHDGGVVCTCPHVPLPDPLAPGNPPQTWETASASTLTCTDPSGALAFATVSTSVALDCGDYYALEYQGTDFGNEQYYDKRTGRLVASFSWGNVTQRCEFYDPSFAAPPVTCHRFDPPCPASDASRARQSACSLPVTCLRIVNACVGKQSDSTSVFYDCLLQVAAAVAMASDLGAACTEIESACVQKCGLAKALPGLAPAATVSCAVDAGP